MKLIALGDLHGRTIWKDIVNKNDYDKIIFIGDYFDSKEGISSQQQQENFKDVITFKKANRENVILLFGNHDFHYLPFVYEYYTGFQPLHKEEIGKLLSRSIDENLLQMCYVSGNFLFTHAGLTKTWCAANAIDVKNPEQQLNDLFQKGPEAFRFTPGENFDSTGDDVTQSPIWVRPKSLMKDKVDNYIQVIGHTHQKRLTVLDGIIIIDSLGTSAEYLEIADGEFHARK